MKDTQGIVSSEAVCYSRHDGYILDSSDSAWKHQIPKTFKKPSKIFRIPEILTSSDRAVCIDCHGQTAIWRYTDFHSPEKREVIRGRRPQ